MTNLFMGLSFVADLNRDFLFDFTPTTGVGPFRDFLPARQICKDFFNLLSKPERCSLKCGARPSGAADSAFASASGRRRAHRLVCAPRKEVRRETRRTTAGAAVLPKIQLHRSG